MPARTSDDPVKRAKRSGMKLNVHCTSECTTRRRVHDAQTDIEPRQRERQRAGDSGEMRVNDECVKADRLFVQMVEVLGDPLHRERQHVELLLLFHRSRIDSSGAHGRQAGGVHPDFDDESPADESEDREQHGVTMPSRRGSRLAAQTVELVVDDQLELVVTPFARALQDPRCLLWPLQAAERDALGVEAKRIVFVAEAAAAGGAGGA